MIKGTCGNLILNNFGYEFDSCFVLENKHRNDPMLGLPLWERKRVRPEGIFKDSHTAPLFVTPCPGQALSPPCPSNALLADHVRNAGHAAWPAACSSRTEMPWVTGEFETWAESNVPVCSYSLESTVAQAAHSTSEGLCREFCALQPRKMQVTLPNLYWIHDCFCCDKCQQCFLSSELYMYSAQSTAAIRNLCFSLLWQWVALMLDQGLWTRNL